MCIGYYDGATQLYEYGWAQSFHFSRFYKGEGFHASLARHEHYLAAQMVLRPGMRVLDVGCGVGLNGQAARRRGARVGVAAVGHGAVRTVIRGAYGYRAPIGRQLRDAAAPDPAPTGDARVAIVPVVERAVGVARTVAVTVVAGVDASAAVHHAAVRVDQRVRRSGRDAAQEASTDG